MAAPILLRLAVLEPIHALALEQGGNWLTTVESTRLSAMASPHRRQQYLAGHWLVRQLASNFAGGDISAWQWSRPEGESSVLRHDDRCLFVSISHSGDWLACAVADEPIGLDIEAMAKSRDYLALAEHVFSPEECAWLHDHPDQLVADFHRFWTIKEATGKRHGRGLRPEVTRRQAPVLAAADDDFEVETWQEAGIAIALSHAGKAAVDALGLSKSARHLRWRIRPLQAND